MGTAAAKQSDEQSYVPPVEEKQTITHIDFDDDSDDGDDDMDTQRREVRHKFASSDSAGRMALERLRSQESQKSSRLTNDEENLEQIEASFIKMTMTPSPKRSKPKKKDSKPYEQDMQPEDERAFDSRNKGLVQHTDKNELLSKIEKIVQEGGGVDQLQFLLERAAIVGVDENNPIMLQAYSACNVWNCPVGTIYTYIIIICRWLY